LEGRRLGAQARAAGKLDHARRCGHARLGVCVFGDKDFLAEIEAVLQQRFRAPVM
jgi:hypothetical protein